MTTTTRVRSEDERGLATAVAELRAMQEVATDILGHLDIEGTLLSVLNAVVRLTRADIAGILLVEEDNVLRMRACTGHRTTATATLKVRSGQGVAGRVLATGRTVKVDDYPDDSSISRHFAAIAEADGTRSALGAPMIVRDRTVGVLMAWRRRRGVFGDVHVRAISNLAHLAAIAIENARLYQAELETVERLTEANRRLVEQYEVLERGSQVQEEMTNLVLEGRPMGDLTSTVARHLGGEAIILDSELTVLDASAQAGDLATAAIGHLKRARSRGEAQGTTVIETGGGSSRWLVAAEVAGGGDRLGHLCVGLPDRPDRFDTVIVEQAAIVCAVELTKEQAVLEARTRVRADFVWDLVEGKVADHAEALVRARSLGYAPPERMRLALLRVERPPSKDAGGGDVADWWLDAVTRRAEAASSALTATPTWAGRRGSLVLLLVSSSDEAGEARALAGELLKRLREAHPEVRVSAGFSTCVRSLGELPRAYAEARQALSAAPLMSSDLPIAVLDDLGVLRFLLAPGNRKALDDFARQLLGPVLDYDRDHATELIRTVDEYLSHDCNLARTADGLYVHPKTVRYRLDRVEELAGLDFYSQRCRFEAQLAINILNALSLTAQPEMARGGEDR